MLKNLKVISPQSNFGTLRHENSRHYLRDNSVMTQLLTVICLSVKLCTHFVSTASLSPRPSPEYSVALIFSPLTVIQSFNSASLTSDLCARFTARATASACGAAGDRVISSMSGFVQPENTSIAAMIFDAPGCSLDSLSQPMACSLPLLALSSCVAWAAQIRMRDRLGCTCLAYRMHLGFTRDVSAAGP